MSIIEPPRAAAPTITWTIVLVIDPGLGCVSEAAQLDTLPPGTSVVLDLGHQVPHDVDPRVVEFVRHAWRSRGLHLELRGPAGPVGAWWHELNGRPRVTASPRHLELIQGGGGS